VNSDPLGKLYQIVVGNVSRKRSGIKMREETREIVEWLFLAVPVTLMNDNFLTNLKECVFSMNELKKAAAN